MEKQYLFNSGKVLRIFADDELASISNFIDEMDNWVPKWASNYRKIKLVDDQTHQNILDEYFGVRKKDKGCIYIPIYLYVHSGMAVSLKPFADEWDSYIGFIVRINKKEWCEKTGSKRCMMSQIMKEVEYEVKYLNAILSGEIFGYTIDGSEDAFDSCSGFWGDDAFKMMADYIDDKEIADFLKKYSISDFYK